MDTTASAAIGILSVAGYAGVPGALIVADALSEIQKCCNRVHVNKVSFYIRSSSYLHVMVKAIESMTRALVRA